MILKKPKKKTKVKAAQKVSKEKRQAETPKGLVVTNRKTFKSTKGLSALQKKQLKSAFKAWDGRAFNLDKRFDFEACADAGGVSIGEQFDYVQFEESGEVLYDGCLLTPDGGSIYKTATTRKVASFGQGGLESRDPDLQFALSSALGRAKKKRAGSKGKSKPKSKSSPIGTYTAMMHRAFSNPEPRSAEVEFMNGVGNLAELAGRENKWARRAPQVLELLFEAPRVHRTSPLWARRERIPSAVASIICGHVHDRFARKPKNKETKDARQATWKVAAKHIHVLEGWLDDAQKGTYAAAALTLVPELFVQTRDRVIAACQKGPPPVRAVLLFAFGRDPGMLEDAELNRLLKAALKDADPIVQGAAAVVSLRLTPSATLKDYGLGLLKWMTLPEHEFHHSWLPLYLRNQNSGAKIARSVRDVFAQRADQRLDWLAHSSQKLKSGNLEPLDAIAADVIGLGKPRRPLVFQVKELSKDERAAIKKFDKTPLLHAASYGLPRKGKSRERWLKGQGVMERSVVHPKATEYDREARKMKKAAGAVPLWRAMQTSSDWIMLRKMVSDVDWYEALVRFEMNDYGAMRDVPGKAHRACVKLLEAYGPKRFQKRALKIIDDYQAETRPVKPYYVVAPTLLLLPFVDAGAPVPGHAHEYVLLNTHDAATKRVFDSLTHKQQEKLIIARCKDDVNAVERFFGACERAVEREGIAHPHPPSKKLLAALKAAKTAQAPKG